MKPTVKKKKEKKESVRYTGTTHKESRDPTIEWKARPFEFSTRLAPTIQRKSLEVTIDVADRNRVD